MLTAIFGIDILDNLLATLMFEIDIDIGRFASLRRNEALEQEIAQCRVDIGYADAIAHGRIGGRTSPLAQDSLRTGKADNVIYGEEVGCILQFTDQLQFMPDLGRHPLGYALRIALGSAFQGEPGKFLLL